MIQAPNDRLFTNSPHPVSQTTIAITGDNLSTFVSHDPGFFFSKMFGLFRLHNMALQLFFKRLQCSYSDLMIWFCNCFAFTEKLLMLMEFVGREDRIKLNMVTALTATKILHRKLVQSDQKSIYIKQIKAQAGLIIYNTSIQCWVLSYSNL